MTKEYKVVKMYLKTYNRIKLKVRPLKDERIIDYFERVSKELQ